MKLTNKSLSLAVGGTVTVLISLTNHIDNLTLGQSFIKPFLARAKPCNFEMWPILAEHFDLISELNEFIERINFKMHFPITWIEKVHTCRNVTECIGRFVDLADTKSRNRRFWSPIVWDCTTICFLKDKRKDDQHTRQLFSYLYLKTSK